MRHILKCDAPEYLPFALSRCKALRATGLEYASQRFESGGFEIKVRIEKDHDYVSISGGADEYHVTPTSAERLEGTVTLDVRLAKKIEFSSGAPEGEIDWLSYDGTLEGVDRYGNHLITWRSGLAGRYDPYYAPTKTVPSSTFLWVDGSKFDVGVVPKGACLSTYIDSAGATVTYVVFATMSTSTITIRYFLLDSATPTVVTSTAAGEYAAPQTGDPDWNSIYTGHVLFCGRGQKLGAMVSTPRSPFSVNGTRFFQVTGDVTADESGVSVIFDHVALPPSINVGTVDTSNTITHNEYVGVDVKLTGEVVAIKHQCVTNSYNDVAEVTSTDRDYGGTEITTTVYAHRVFTVSLHVGAATLFSDESKTAQLTEVETYSNDYFTYENFALQQYLQVTSTRAINRGRQVEAVYVHDLDARFNTYAATKTSTRDSVPTDVTYGQTADRLSGGEAVITVHPSVVASTLTPKITSTMVILKPDGTVVSKPYQNAVLESEAVLFGHYYLPGTPTTTPLGDILSDTVAHSVYLSGRRVASRSHRSFLGSTHPFSERIYEGDAEVWQKTENRTLTAFSKGAIVNDNATVPAKRVKLLTEPDPDAELVNTEISLFPLTPVWGR